MRDPVCSRCGQRHVKHPLVEAAERAVECVAQAERTSSREDIQRARQVHARVLQRMRTEIKAQLGHLAALDGHPPRPAPAARVATYRPPVLHADEPTPEARELLRDPRAFLARMAAREAPAPRYNPTPEREPWAVAPPDTCRDELERIRRIAEEETPRETPLFLRGPRTPGHPDGCICADCCVLLGLLESPPAE